MNFAFRIVTAATTANANDRVIGVDTTSAPVTVTLPSASSVRSGFILTIKDTAGNCVTNNITVSRGAGDTIDAAANVTLNAKYAAISLVSNGSNAWHVY